MNMTTNDDKMFRTVLSDSRLMELGGYTVADIPEITRAVNSDNSVIGAVALIITLTSARNTERDVWNSINNYLKGKV